MGREAFSGRGSTEDVKRLQKEARKENLAKTKKKFPAQSGGTAFASNKLQAAVEQSGRQWQVYNPNKKSLVADDPWKLATWTSTAFYAPLLIPPTSRQSVLLTLAEVKQDGSREREVSDRGGGEVGRFQASKPNASALWPGWDFLELSSSTAMTPLPPVLHCSVSRGLRDRGHITSIWKVLKCWSPVPQENPPRLPSTDYRPHCPLTIYPLSKCMERIVLKTTALRLPSRFQGPVCSFAYTPKQKTQRECHPDCGRMPVFEKHLEKPKGPLPGLLFLDFSSAFQHNPGLTCWCGSWWFMDVNPRDHPLALQPSWQDRPQTCLWSGSSTTLGGVIRGPHQHWSPSRMCALPCVCFTLYTSDCRCTCQRPHFRLSFSGRTTSLTGPHHKRREKTRTAVPVEKLVGWCNRQTTSFPNVLQRRRR